MIVDHDEPSKCLKVLKFHSRYLKYLIGVEKEVMPLDMDKSEVLSYMAHLMERKMQRRGMSKKWITEYMRVWNAY